MPTVRDGGEGLPLSQVTVRGYRPAGRVSGREPVEFDSAAPVLPDDHLHDAPYRLVDQEIVNCLLAVTFTSPGGLVALVGPSTIVTST